MQRVVVIGTTGSGKSTMAHKVANAISANAIDLDDLLWQPGWVKRPAEEIIELLREPLQAERWVIAGNNRKSRDFIWAQADTVIWLNYSFLVNFSRLLFRTIKRVATRQEVMPGCVETFRSQFLDPDSLLVWFFQTFWKRKKEYRELLANPGYAHLTAIEFNHPRQARHFFNDLYDSKNG